MPLGLPDLMPTKALDVSTLDGERPTLEALWSQAAKRAGKYWDTILIGGYDRKDNNYIWEIRLVLSQDSQMIELEIAGPVELDTNPGRTINWIIDSWVAAWSYPLESIEWKKTESDSSRLQKVRGVRFPWKMLLELPADLENGFRDCRFAIDKIFFNQLPPRLIADLPFTVYPS